MAKVENIIPFIVKWESGTVMRKGEPFERLFERAKKRGISDDPDDLSRLTVVGVTYATYKQYCKRKGYPAPTTHRFLNLEGCHRTDGFTFISRPDHIWRAEAFQPAAFRYPSL